MAKIVVDVMLKPEIHDPQGEAIAGACHRLGFTEVVSVRQGKRFEVELADAVTRADRARNSDPPNWRPNCSANPIIEEFAIQRSPSARPNCSANPIIEEFAIHGA